MTRYRPIGYCTACRRPIFELGALNLPCATNYFGVSCNGTIISALDLANWDECGCRSKDLTRPKQNCCQCGGYGWKPRKDQEVHHLNHARHTEQI